MNGPSPAMHNLARCLLAREAALQSPPQPGIPTLHGQDVLRVCEKLRVSLTRFAGPNGFTALLRRALALAKADFPALETVKITADGRLEGFEYLTAEAGNIGIEAAIAISAYLLDLLISFIGQPLTLRLLREVWPELSFDD